MAEEVTWNTDASLYEDELDKAEKDNDAPSHLESAVLPQATRRGMMIQDVLLPGYYDEWAEKRKVGCCNSGCQCESQRDYYACHALLFVYDCRMAAGRSLA